MAGYSNIDNNTEKVILDVMNKWFSELRMSWIKPLFYTKKKMKGKSRIIMAYVRKMSEFEQYLCGSDDYEYFLFIDGNIWPELSPDDKVRLVRHELRHILIDYDKNGDIRYLMADHNLIDFREDYKIEHGKEYEDPFRIASIVAEEVYAKLDGKASKTKQLKNDLDASIKFDEVSIQNG